VNSKKTTPQSTSKQAALKKSINESLNKPRKFQIQNKKERKLKPKLICKKAMHARTAPTQK